MACQLKAHAWKIHEVKRQAVGIFQVLCFSECLKYQSFRPHPSDKGNSSRTMEPFESIFGLETRIRMDKQYETLVLFLQVILIKV